jgi:hypothetical protein
LLQTELPIQAVVAVVVVIFQVVSMETAQMAEAE